MISALGLCGTAAGLIVSNAAKLAKLRPAPGEHTENYGHLRGSHCSIHDDLRCLEKRLYPLEGDQKLRETGRTMEVERHRKEQDRATRDQLQAEPINATVI